jgi:DDE superfamily endonuclease
MEDVLELYAEEYQVDYPVVCFDESPYQLISETRVPVPAAPGQPARVDHEYRREGTCNLFMLVEPLRGWRHVDVTERRTTADFAAQMKALVDVHYPDATLITVVLDNLNTHTLAALYEVYLPAEARRIAKKLELRHTPKHGSWLNMAEVEFAVVHGQCLDRRIGSIAMVKQEIAAWETERNAANAMIKWQFTLDKARKKLHRLYPSQS